MGMFEYSVQLSSASSPEDMKFVADAFKAGQKKKQDEIWSKLQELSPGYNNVYISKEELNRIIYE
jgi:hypothetical protein